MTPGLVRLLMVHLHRFTREPETREASSFGLLHAALALHAETTSLEEAAPNVSEVLGSLSATRRQQRRRA